MKVRRLLTLAVLAVAFACQDQKAPTDPSGVKPPSDPSMLISDGAHGGNPDFFFLPPLLPNPSSSPNYEVGRANTRLASALTVEICELQDPPVNGQGEAVVTDCIAGPPLKKFPAGTVKLADSGNDGFYMAQWKPSESNLVLSKYYRIKVLIEGSTGAPLGAADLDPVANQKELKNVRTGELIPLTADGTLPIKFRVEKGGGPPVCGLAVLCTSTVVTNNSPTGSTIVTVDGGSGAVAGAKFPNGWLPDDGPQSVVVTIASVNTGITNPATGTESIPCHAGVTLQQFRGCFNFTTTPTLDPINGESGPQFAIPVTVAVCYVLQGTGDPREKFAEMWASGPGETPHPLEDASDVGILSANTRDCSNSVIGLNNDKGITGLASAGWRKVKAGFGRVFGVQTAYAVDLGLGGFISEFSNVGPVLSAEIDPVGSTELTGSGVLHPQVRIIGSNHHDGHHHNETGLGGLPVTWTTSGGAIVNVPGTEGGTATAVTDTTNRLAINPESPTSGGGFATVDWTVPSTPGTYTLTANGPTTGGPVTFTAVVTEQLPFINFETYPAGAGVCDGAASCAVSDEFESEGVVFEFSPFIDVSNTASLCLKPFNPVGETPNYGISPLAIGGGCGSWATGIVTMQFGENPTTVEFELQGNNTLTEGPFVATAVGGNEQPVTVTRESVVTYSPSTGLTFRREIRRATSTSGIASVSVTSGNGVVFIDKLLITQ